MKEAVSKRTREDGPTGETLVWPITGVVPPPPHFHLPLPKGLVYLAWRQSGRRFNVKRDRRRQLVTVLRREKRGGTLSNVTHTHAHAHQDLPALDNSPAAEAWGTVLGWRCRKQKKNEYAAGSVGIADPSL